MNDAKVKAMNGPFHVQLGTSTLGLVSPFLSAVPKRIQYHWGGIFQVQESIQCSFPRTHKSYKHADMNQCLSQELARMSSSLWHTAERDYTLIRDYERTVNTHG